MANSCLSTSAHAALRVPCPKLSVEAAWTQLHLQNASVFSRSAGAHRRVVSDHVAEPVVPVARRRRHGLAVTAVVSQGEAAAAAVAEEQSQEHGTMATKLYFGNLPYNCDSAQLAGVVQEYATPEMVEVLYDRMTGRSRGYAFVTMATIEDCKLVIKNLDGSMYDGRTMNVNFADRPRTKLPRYPETEHKLFVGNLSWSVTTEMLTEAFQRCGNVVGARVLYDGETGRSRGFGFVCYSTREEMEEALSSLDGMEVEGREIRVNLPQQKR